MFVFDIILNGFHIIITFIIINFVFFSLRSNFYAEYKPQSLLRIPTAPHSCPAVSSDSPLHVTMEWDPYDPNCGQWMEYIIPGVTYPPVPLLNERQYWL